MARNLKKPVLAMVAAIVILLAIPGLGLVPLKLNFAKPTISEAALEQLGLAIEIEGPLRLRLGPRPELSASSISIRSHDAGDEPLAMIEKLTVRPSLLRLLKKQLDLKRVEGSGITINLGDYPLEGYLPDKLDLRASAPLSGPLEIRISAHSHQPPFELVASGESLSRLLENPEAYSLTARFSALAAELRLDGTVLFPAEGPQLQASVEFSTEDLPRLLGSVGMDAPQFSSLSAQSSIEVSSDQFLARNGMLLLDDIPAGFSGLARNVHSRPRLQLDLTLARLDFDSFENQDDSSLSLKELLSEDLQSFYQQLSGFDGRFTLRIGELVNAPVALTVDDLALEAGLEQGRLALQQASVVIDGSEITARAVLDTRAACVTLETSLFTPTFDLQTLERIIAAESGLGGSIENLDLTSQSCGATLGEHKGSLRLWAATAGLKPSMESQGLPFQLGRLTAQVNWNQPGELSFDGQLLDVPLSARINFGPVEAMLSGQPAALDIVVQAERFEASMNGKAAMGDGGLELDATLTAEATQLGSLHSWLGIDPGNRISFSGQSGIRLDDAGLVIRDMIIKLGESDLRGNLQWAGPDSGKAIYLNARSNRLVLDEIAELFSDSPEQESGWDWPQPLTEQEWIERWFSFPDIDFDVTVDSLGSFGRETGDVWLRSGLRDRRIEGGKLSFQVEGIDVKGAIDVDLSSKPWQLDFESELSNIDIGRFLDAFDLAKGVDARAGHAEIRLVTAGNSLEELSRALRLESKIEDLRWVFEAGPENRPFDIALSELELVSSQSQNTIWKTSGELNGSTLKAWMQTPSLPDTFDPGISLPLTLVIGAGDGVIMLDLDIDQRSENGWRGRAVLSGDYLDLALEDFQDLRSPLDAWELQALVRKDEAVHLELKARTGMSRAGGIIEIIQAGSGFHFDIDLASPFLETDDLVHWVEEFRTARGLIQGEKAGEADEEEVPDTVPTGLLMLIGQYIDEYTRQHDFTISVSIDELRSSDTLLGRSVLEMKASEEEFVIGPLTIDLPGGNVDVNYLARNLNGGWEYTIELDVEKLEYGGLLRLFDANSQAEGELFLDARLVSRASNPALAIGNLEGNVDLAAFPANARADFLDIWASNLIFALLPGTDGSSKKLNCLVARFDVEKGVMRSRNTLLDSTDIIVRAQGDIDLGGAQLDLLVAPQAKREKFLSVSAPLKVTGPFDDFQVAVAPGGFLNTMFRWYYGLIYVPWKWLTGERFPADGIATCYKAMDWEPPLH